MRKSLCSATVLAWLSALLLAIPGLADTTNVTPSFRPISPGPADGRIAFITAGMLQQHHYLRQKFDDSVSSKFLDRYLETLDPQHLHFLQSDLAQFEHYRAELDDLTITPRNVADTKPAFVIFNKFMERLQQRVAYADELLKTERFVFDTDERIAINRHELPYPKDLAEAKKLWRERLRFEYLQEKLGKTAAKKKKAESAKKEDAAKTRPADSDKKPKSEEEQIVDTLSHRYHRNVRTFIDWNNDDVLQVYLSALAHVYDPHSDYMNQAQLDSFSIGMSLRLFGIGAELVSEDGYCTIRRLLPGGPAAKSKKIKEKDRIIAVAQGDQSPVDVVEMNLTKAVQLIRGPKGTEVRLTVIPADEDASAANVISLTRDEIKLEDQEAKAKVIELPRADGSTTRLGVIDLPSFYATFDVGMRERSEIKSTTVDVARLLAKLKQENVNGVILDLRRNGGGSLEEAINLTGLFIKEGPVVQVWNGIPEREVEQDYDKDPSVLYEGPLIVLTSRFSASASEILAGALQDYGRALIVGDAGTHGKGTVQSVNGLKPLMDKSLTNEPGALKLTIKKFYRASGASTQLRGVAPDIILPSVANESKDIGESALDNPLPWDTIPSAKYERLNMVAPYVSDLLKRSSERVAVDPEFAYVREDIEQYKQMQADKTLSLNEKQRLKEKDEADARQKARDKERLARAEPDEKIYELTLRNITSPGLPPPVEKTNSVAKLSGRAVGGLVSTNSASTTSPAPAIDDDAEEEKAPVVDATLLEAQHILMDYVSALSKKNVARAGEINRNLTP
jgi:carboxyl-terminal processing protease